MQPQLLWKSNRYYISWVCVFNLSYPACNAYVPCYIIVWGLSGSTFFHIISQTARFSEKVAKYKTRIFIFPYNFCLKHFSFYEEFSEISSQMYTGLHVKYPLVWSDFNETEFSRQTFENSSNIKFHENRTVQAEMFHADRQTDKHDEANSCFPLFCERAYKRLIHIKVVPAKLNVSWWNA